MNKNIIYLGLALSILTGCSKVSEEEIITEEVSVTEDTEESEELESEEFEWGTRELLNVEILEQEVKHGEFDVGLMSSSKYSFIPNEKYLEHYEKQYEEELEEGKEVTLITFEIDIEYHGDELAHLNPNVGRAKLSGSDEKGNWADLRIGDQLIKDYREEGDSVSGEIVYVINEEPDKVNEIEYKIYSARTRDFLSKYADDMVFNVKY